MSRQFRIENRHYKLQEFRAFLGRKMTVVLSDEVRGDIQAGRDALEAALGAAKTPIYGINTGFGKLSGVTIPADDIRKLQRNLILSHAVGMGEPLADDVVRLTLLLKILSLSKGASGVRVNLVENLLTLLNSGAVPVVPSQGSVGASGDLTPLAHLVLPLIGAGEVILEGKSMSGMNLLERLDMKPMQLEAKEGLALINGTQVSTALALQGAQRLDELVRTADIMAALAVDGMKGTTEPFREDVHRFKAHRGQQAVAGNLRLLLEGSTIRESHRHGDARIQDRYSLRCIPQVHGACRDMLSHACSQVLNEANSISDNPLVMTESKEVVSTGHFHGQYVGLASDIMAIVAAELAGISERRLFALMMAGEGVPPFLTPKPGLNSGLMMTQVTSAALVSENKTLAHPASVDSIPTGADQEDYVPMSAWAGRKLLQVIANLERVLAMEYLGACQAIGFHQKLRSGKGADAAYRLLREKVPFIEEDRDISGDLTVVCELIRSGAVLAAVSKEVTLT